MSMQSYVLDNSSTLSRHAFIPGGHRGNADEEVMKENVYQITNCTDYKDGNDDVLKQQEYNMEEHIQRCSHMMTVT